MLVCCLFGFGQCVQCILLGDVCFVVGVVWSLWNNVVCVMVRLGFVVCHEWVGGVLSVVMWQRCWFCFDWDLAVVVCCRVLGACEDIEWRGVYVVFVAGVRWCRGSVVVGCFIFFVRNFGKLVRGYGFGGVAFE